jgi:N-acetyl-gamma-glutamyl-phosphate reductase
MVRVGILGATGYTALELIKLLLRHPDVEITDLTTRQDQRPHVSSIHPQLTGRLDLCLENGPPEAVAARTDCIFSCLPHAASAPLIMKILDKVRVVDFSADYRLRDAATYEKWYGNQHPDPGRLGQIVYGLPEFFRDEIARSRIVANPGCYSSTSILALGPLLVDRLVDPRDIIIDAKGGVSGAGRTPKLGTLFPECNESLAAYGVGQHRHTPEIEQVLSLRSDQDVEVIFTPHLVPMDRGILCTIYAQPLSGSDGAKMTEAELLSRYRDFYADSPFIRVVDHLPATKHVTGTNFCDITLRKTKGKLIVIACTDNLLKGASGLAVQNFNLMFGFEETTGLL